MTDILAEPLDRLLGTRNTSQTLRQLFDGASLEPISAEIAALGYHDALVAEDDGGLGLQLADLSAMLITLGRRLCPVPLGQTIVARALLAQAEVAAPDGHILLLSPLVNGDGPIHAPATPSALAASHALLDLGEMHVLVAIADAQLRPVAPGLSLAADVRWASLPDNAIIIGAMSGPLLPTAAALGAATIAGCIAGALELTTRYATTRRQFGKPITDFQAIQQQLAVLAEEAAAAAMAAAIGCQGSSPLVDPLAAAVAKMRCSIAATRASAIAHAVHGAIGFSEEYDLQLFTRRLAEERLTNGGEAFWAERIGRARLAAETTSTIAFVQDNIGQAG